MAAELTLPRNQPRSREAVKVYRGESKGTALRRLLFCFQVCAVVLVIALSIISFLTYNAYSQFAEQIDQQIAGGFLRGHAGLYAAPRVIEKGARVSPEKLVLDLQRAGYTSGEVSNIWSGSFKTMDHAVRISPRQGTESHEWIDIKFDKQNRVDAFATSDGTAINSYSLEPELLTADAGLKTGQQETLTFKDIPPVLVQAITAIEDRRFFQHQGVDVRGIGRAFLSWVSSGSIKYRQGGSTITQQLVKNTYLTPEKTLQRKFNEAMLAIALERRLSKQDIFALYCNEIYLGQRNGVGVRGVAQAARVFFGKELKDINVEEAATLAGMIQSPARYAPDRHPEAAKNRRDKVIGAMKAEGFIGDSIAQDAASSPVLVAPFESGANELAPYYIDAVNRALDTAQNGSDTEVEQTMRVQTSIDPDLQAAAENALRHQLDLLGKSKKGSPQGALVALDVHTGRVLAMVGGRNYAESQLNRATDAKRQPGSVFKPFVYATALESGISPLSIYRDAPQTFQYGGATYSPANFGKSYSMHDVLLREGLVRSLNVVTVDLAIRTGLVRVASTAARFGIESPPVAYPSLALGTTEVTPLKIAAAYAAFANGGTVYEPTVFEGAVDNNGGPLFRAQSSETHVIRPTTAYMITDMLSDVITRGTARRAKGALGNTAIAGKTGTSRDGWFVGYTPNLVCAVWIGFDDNEQLGLTGAEAALPAWTDFM
ncbi:MAG TPA: PBP1A family penicillin-binding protein, partial [Pyrinomonadaceae bacterium]